MEDFSPSRGWAAEDLTRMYDLMTNGGSGAGDYAASAGAWGVRPEQIQQMAIAAEENNRKREADALAYRAAIQKAMLAAQSNVALAKAQDRSQAALIRAMGAQKAGTAANTATTPSLPAFQGFSAAQKAALIAAGMNPQDIGSLEGQFSQGRQDETSPQVMNQYLRARDELANAGAEKATQEKAAAKGWKVTPDMRMSSPTYQKLSPMQQRDIDRRMGMGPESLQEIPEGRAVLEEWSKAPGQKKTAPGKQASAADDIVNRAYRGLANAEDPRMAGVGGPTSMAYDDLTQGPVSLPNSREGYADVPAELQRALSNARNPATPLPKPQGVNPFQGEPLPHPEITQGSAAEGNPMLSYFRPQPRYVPTSNVDFQQSRRDVDRLQGELDRTPNGASLVNKNRALIEQELAAAREARDTAALKVTSDVQGYNRTDQYGRPLNAQGKPTANWRGEPYPTQAPAGTPGYAEKLQAAFGPAQRDLDADTIRKQKLAMGLPLMDANGVTSGLGELLDTMISGVPLKTAALGATAVGLGGGLVGRRLAQKGATGVGEMTAGYMAPGTRTATQAFNRGYLAPGQQVVRSPQVRWNEPPPSPIGGEATPRVLADPSRVDITRGGQLPPWFKQWAESMF